MTAPHEAVQTGLTSRRG